MQQKVKRILRSAREIRKMRAAGLVVWQAHQIASRLICPGVNTAALNKAVADTFGLYGATPLFLDYGGPPPFPAETCISVNEEVVHGIPGPRQLKSGDIVSLDTGCRLNGWCGDAAVTHAVGEISPVKKKLLSITQAVLDLAIDLMQSKRMWSQVAREMEAFVHGAGFSVVEQMVGHGIGQLMHEAPQVPNYYSREFAEKGDFDLREGLVLAVEPMVNAGVKEVECLDDGWTLVTIDHKPSAHFEHTIAITKDGPQRLTGSPNDDELQGMPEFLHDKSSWILW